MWRLPDPRYDVASAISQGRRDYQEDALVTDFSVSEDHGMIVLADGMGGHAAGDVASKLVVTEVYGALKLKSGHFALDDGAGIPSTMMDAAVRANNSVREHVTENPETKGMGATLVSLVLLDRRLFWNSIGDSPLFNFRAGKLIQLNEDHSMAPQIDLMAKSGLMDPEVARMHPDRNCLTSVIYGEAVTKVDCPKTPYSLEKGDILVVSSDGLQYLDEKSIERLLQRHRRKSAAELSSILLAAVEDLKDPDQDNISICVVKVNHTMEARHSLAPANRNEAMSSTPSMTRLADMSKLTDYAQSLFSPMPKPAAGKRAGMGESKIALQGQ